MAIYPIALITATLASGGAWPMTLQWGNAIVGGVQASAYAGPARSTATGPIPKNAASWVGLADYPPEARAANRTGKTAFRVQIDKKGSVTSCEIIESSGHADLDHITCLRIAERAVFEPARTAKGRATMGTYRNSVRWQGY